MEKCFRKDREERGIPIIAQIIAFPLLVMMSGLALFGMFPLVFWYVLYMSLVAALFVSYYLLTLPMAKRLRSYDQPRRDDSS